MNDKQIKASFLPSVQNGPTVNPFARAKQISVAMNVIGEGGVAGDNIDMVLEDMGKTVEVKQVFVRLVDTHYLGSTDNTGFYYQTVP